MTDLATSTTLRVYLFGRFRVESSRGEVRLPTRKAELLLAFLLLHPGQHSREKTAALLWGDSPDASARASLRNALSILRKRLDAHLLLTDRDTLQLNSDRPIWVDALRFQAQATQFLESPSPDPTLVDVDLYRDDLLTDFYDDWVLTQREAFRSLYVDTLLELTQQMRSQSEYERAVEFANLVLGTDRANERAHQHLMFCHIALGHRDAALRQHESCRIALREELGVEPSHATRKLHEWIKQAPLERMPIEASITNLPIPLTGFVGRHREMAAVKKLLATERLVTLTGTGGSGKTRLAIQVATDLLDVFAEGVWWIELAALSDPQLLPRTVAKALGVPEVPDQEIDDTLTNFLHSKNLLLVLDNCEHLITDCARLAQRLLHDSSDLRILATSRERLGLAGEFIQPVSRLSLPDAQHLPRGEDVLDYEAVRLFVDRARVVDPDFRLTEETAPDVTSICHRLEGLPLAIELAAARTSVLTVAQIAARLDDVFDLLRSGARAAPRHQTLLAAIDWSHDLLADEERVLFRRLSVFAGGWTLPAAEAICGGAGLETRQIVDVLGRLVDKSLVEVHTRGDEKRYRLLDTIRRYSRQKLIESEEPGAIADGHLGFFRQLSEAANPHLGYFLSDSDADVWRGRLEADYENLRAAVHRSLEDGRNTSTEAGLRLAVSLHWFWFARGHFSEGRSWLARLLDTAGDVPPGTRAQALLTAGYLACWQGDFASGRPALEEALGLFRLLGDRNGIGFAFHGLGFVALGQGEAASSRSLFEDSLKEAREVEDPWLTSFALHFLAIVLTYQGDHETAVAHFEEGNTLLAHLGGHRQALAFSLFHLARIARLRGDYSEARSRHAEGMKLFDRANDRRGLAYSLAGFAVLAAAEGDTMRAARLSGAVASMQSVLGSFLEAPLQVEYDQELAAVRSVLDTEEFSTSFAEGRAMTMEQAIEYALVPMSG